MDEAETGLKSSLAVKIFGPELATLEDRAVQVKNIIGKVPGITEITVVRELGQPSSGHHSGPRQAGALRTERERREYPGGDRHGRHRRHAGDSGRAPVRPGGAHAGAFPQRRERHQEPADRHARRPVSAPQPVLRDQGGKRRFVHLSRGEFALYRRAVQRGRPRPGQRGGRGPAESGCRGETAHRVQVRLGRGIQGISGIAASR